MTKYEIMYIINPTILEEGRDAVIAKVDAVLTEAAATITKTEKWGERKLAYPIDKRKTGFYVLTHVRNGRYKISRCRNKAYTTQQVILDTSSLNKTNSKIY